MCKLYHTLCCQNTCAAEARREEMGAERVEVGVVSDRVGTTRGVLILTGEVLLHRQPSRSYTAHHAYHDEF